MKETESMAGSSPSKPWSETRRGRIVILAGVVGLFVLVFWLATKSRRMLSEPAALLVNEQYLSFGEVWEDSAFVWTLRIRNTTDEDIEITDFIANCPCGKIEPRSLKIPARGTKEINLTLDLRDPHIEPIKGPKKFAIKLIPVFSYGLDPRGGWEIHGRIRVPAELDPPSLSFEYLEKHPPRSLMQVVRVKCLCPCEKVVSKCDADFASVQVTKDADMSDEFRVDVRLSTHFSVGMHQFAIPLQLWMKDPQQYALIQLPVSVEAKSEYYLVPSLANWGAFKIGEPSTELIQMRSRSGKEFTVKKIMCESSNIKVAQLDSLSSSSHIFRVESLFNVPGGHIENVEFYVQEGSDQSNGRSELERIRLKIKCQIFSE